MSHYALEPVVYAPCRMRKAKLKDKGISVTTSLKPQPVFPHTMTSIFIYGPNARLLGAALYPEDKPDLLIRSLKRKRRAYGISVILLTDISSTMFVFAPRVLYL